jgi:predicted transposase YbfD/YdcC
MITLIAVMAEADEWIEIGLFAKSKDAWLRTFLPLANGIPSHDTIQRVMSRIDGSVLYSLTIQFLVKRIEMLSETAWMLRLKTEAGEDEGEAGPRVIAFDGKTSRGSKRNKTDRDVVKAIHTVSAYSTDYGLSLSEAVVNEKTNEIPTVREMLDITNVEGCVVTWDALNTQKETVKKVVEKRGEYVGALKANQQSFYEDVKEYFDDETCRKLKGEKESCLKTVDKEQSGVAVREYYLSCDIKWLSQLKDWARLTAIGCVIRTLTKLSGEITVDTRYFIASIADINSFAKSVRWHWQVENKLRWHLDFTFADDHNTTTEKHGAQNLQTMKRVSLAILTLVQLYYKTSIKNIRYTLALNFEHDIEKIFKLLNADALRSLLLPSPE